MSVTVLLHSTDSSAEILVARLTTTATQVISGVYTAGIVESPPSGIDVIQANVGVAPQRGYLEFSDIAIPAGHSITSLTLVLYARCTTDGPDRCPSEPLLVTPCAEPRWDLENLFSTNLPPLLGSNLGTPSFDGSKRVYDASVIGPALETTGAALFELRTEGMSPLGSVVHYYTLPISDPSHDNAPRLIIEHVPTVVQNSNETSASFAQIKAMYR